MRKGGSGPVDSRPLDAGTGRAGNESIRALLDEAFSRPDSPKRNATSCPEHD